MHTIPKKNQIGKHAIAVARTSESTNPRNPGAPGGANASGNSGHIATGVNVPGFRDHEMIRKPGARQSET